MSGLREKQKAERQRRLVRAAAAHFREAGFEKTRIEEIAATAELSAGTVYNYYRHKGELLIAVVAMEVHEVLAAGEPLVQHPPETAESAINALIDTYLDHALVYLSKDNWRHAMAAAIAQPDAVLARRYTELDARLADQVRRLLDSLQQRGAVRADLDTIAFGKMIFNNTNQLFTEYVKEEGQELAELKAGLRAQHAALCRLIA
ncbi:transcriptional regulator, TetR family [Tistlia consotensis]|uniref:Transcriptional regulator, TetR family n=1 Tax=Tistlia consotensis USBA 355 TaxID=560819 RepID=A0A1Y6CA71_9PROT|nr:TetR/AcrR family transcriptional regulator [Tistlia consotensis]SMF51571.1 transcriptional regulator, TetR family [Tistlia consotensis USBA 355]SNR84002.1 transcriptional regulator, TetR family [Tistlia consotensis]